MFALCVSSFVLNVRLISVQVEPKFPIDFTDRAYQASLQSKIIYYLLFIHLDDKRRDKLANLGAAI